MGFTIVMDNYIELLDGCLGVQYNSSNPEETKIYLIKDDNQRFEVKLAPSQIKKVKEFIDYVDKMSS